MSLIFEQIRTGGDRNFGYLLGDAESKRAALIDPSYSPEVLVERAREQSLTVTYIINTHGHTDHINGNAKAQELTRAPIVAHRDSPAFPEIQLEDNQELLLGSLTLKFLHTPGHCADHLVIYEPNYQFALTGDLLFVGKVGGTNTEEDARTEWDSLHRVMKLPGATTLWPGHDYGARPASTIALEKRTNPFLLCADVDAFLQLKADWPVYKKTHGLR